MSVKLKLKVTGARVHDVGYRAFLLEAAEDLGLNGFNARNVTEEGMQVVMVCLEGDDALLAEFQRTARLQRPDKADVSDVVFSEHSGTVEDIGVFAARFQARQLRKGISAIIRMEEKQDLMLEKQDQMISLQSKTIDKLDETKVEIIGKLDENQKATVKAIRDSSEAIIDELRDSREGTVEDIRDLRVDLRSSLDKKLSRMEKDISQLKARSGA
jgi:acylphosphatase